MIAKFVKHKSDLSEEEFVTTLVTIIVLFCASGTGILWMSGFRHERGSYDPAFEIDPRFLYCDHFCM